MPRPGGTVDRGYDHAHRQERKRWQPDVEAGTVDCHARACLEEAAGRGRLIYPGQPWDLGHTEDRAGWTGPEHARCNRADGAKRSHRGRAPATPTPRRWQL